MAHGEQLSVTPLLTVPAPIPGIAPMLGVPPSRRPLTVPGPSFCGDIGADQPWGAWLDVPHGGLVAVDVHWDGGSGPTVRMATPEGEWWIPEQQPGPPVYRSWIPVPAGWTWISVEAGFVDRLAIEVATFLPVAPTT